jgi:hypothetical protein
VTRAWEIEDPWFVYQCPATLGGNVWRLYEPFTSKVREFVCETALAAECMAQYFGARVSMCEPERHDPRRALTYENLEETLSIGGLQGTGGRGHDDGEDNR